eukprot:c16266_g1_i2 orf=599-2371(-)
MAQKRHFKDVDPDDNGSEDKGHRTSLQSAVLEAVRANTMQKFWVVLEPMVRRVVSEEVERAIAKYLPPGKLGPRLPSKQLQGSEPTSLRLQFQNKLALPLYTGCKVAGEQGNSIRVFLQDATTGEVVIAEDESSMKLDIVVLEGDFPDDEDGDWTYEDFENHVVKERDGKRPLLTGDLSISLKEGMGTLGELIFTDNSSWIRSRKFRLGVRLSTGCLNGLRVREAKTEAFFVKDHRGQLYEKHYPPNLNDDVWRLEKIGKDGAYHKRLCEYHVSTVEDFLIMYATGPSRLREIFGTTMSTKTWDSIIEHAKTCILNETQHVYYPDDRHTIGVVLNTIYQPLGMLRNGSFVPISSLSDTEQVYMDRLLQEAYSDPNSLRKLPPMPNYCQELDVPRSGRTRQIYDGLSQIEGPERQQFQAQRNAQSLYENNGATSYTTGYTPNTIQNDAAASTIGIGIKQSLFTNVFSSGTLESLFAYGNHYPKEAEPMCNDISLYQSHSKYLDDCNHGRAFGSWGNDELLMLSGVSTGPFSNAFAPENLKYPLSRCHNVRGDGTYRRPYMGWIKLKAVLKWSYLMKKVIASRRRPELELLE